MMIKVQTIRKGVPSYVRCGCTERARGKLVTVARLILSPAPGRVIRYRDGDPRNLRRTNLMIVLGGGSPSDFEARSIFEREFAAESEARWAPVRKRLECRRRRGALSSWALRRRRHADVFIRGLRRHGGAIVRVKFME